MKIVVPLAIALLAAGCADTRPASQPASTPRAAAVAPQPQPSAEVRDAQQRLRALGYYDRSVDGLWGPDTQAAVERFQRSRNLPMTARLDGATMSALRTAQSEPITITDQTDVRTVQNRLRQLNFYKGPADGVWGSGTQIALENFQRARGLQVGHVTGPTLVAMGLDPAAFPARPDTRGSVASMTGSTLEPNVVRGIQQRLRQTGFYRGPVDGVWGAGSQAALERFQKSRGLEANGQLNPTTISSLGLDPNNLSASTR